jgi:hypothetical protein
MLTDEQYGQQLGARLRQETDDLRAAPDLVHTLRRKQTRRTWMIRGATLTAVAAAAAIAVVITTTGGRAPVEQRQAAPPPRTGTTTEAPVVNLAYVQQRTIEAVGKAADYVIFAKNTYGGGYYDEWIDKATQRYRNDVYDKSVTMRGTAADGKITVPAQPPQVPVHLHQSHAVSGPPGDQTVTTIDYDARTWSVGHLTDRPEPASNVDVTDADSVRKAITSGTVSLVGKETLDGRDTLHLRVFGPDHSYRIDMWVESTSYLPVREAAAKSTGPDEFPESATVTTTYTWLPRTEENLAKLTLTPPPGFTRN